MRKRERERLTENYYEENDGESGDGENDGRDGRRVAGAGARFVRDIYIPDLDASEGVEEIVEIRFPNLQLREFKISGMEFTIDTRNHQEVLHLKKSPYLLANS